MGSPIQRAVGQVFVPVRDMASAIDWYSKLLGFEPAASSHEGTIFDIPTEGETGLALDSNRPHFDSSGPPRFFLWTQDMAATVRHLDDLRVKITSAVEDIGSVLFVQFEDPDGNPLMVCQRRRTPLSAIVHADPDTRPGAGPSGSRQLRTSFGCRRACERGRPHALCGRRERVQHRSRVRRDPNQPNRS